MSESSIFAELLSYNIRRLRKLHKMSQLELSACSGLSLAFINSIEKKGVSADTLEKLANSLQAKPHELFLPENPSSELKIAENHRHVLNELRDILETYGAET